MPLGIFVISFLDEDASLDFSIFHNNEVTQEEIRDIFLGMEIEKGTIQHLFTSSLKILYYAVATEEKESLLGLVLNLKEDPKLFEDQFKEEAELLLQGERDENFPSNLKSSYQRIVQKAIKDIEERITETAKKEGEEEKKNVKKLQEELKKLYDEERELLAKLEKEERTNSIIEKIEDVMKKQKKLEELIQTQKNIEIFKEDEKSSDLKKELVELKEIYNKINEFTVIQAPVKTEKVTKEEIEQKEPEPLQEAVPDSELTDLMQRLQTLSSKRLTSQEELVPSESSKAPIPETQAYDEKIEPITEPPSSEVSVSEPESKEARLSRILTEKFGKAKGVILEYLYWIKKPRTIAEISQDLEIPPEKIVEPVLDLTKKGCICQMTKKSGKEIHLTVCPSCPLKLKCGKKSSIDWEQILS